MIVAAPPQPATHMNCSFYGELADDEVMARYRKNEIEILASREGSSFLRQMLLMWRMQERLSAVAAVSQDWDTFGSEAPNRDAVLAAGNILKSLIRSDVVPDAILPSAEGGVAICFVRGNRYADIECLNSGEILAVTSTRHERPYVWNLDQDSIATDSAARAISTYLAP